MSDAQTIPPDPRATANSFLETATEIRVILMQPESTSPDFLYPVILAGDDKETKHVHFIT